MAEQKKLPVGIDSFEKIRTEGFYYVDKTGLIKELLDNWTESLQAVWIRETITAN